jgi:hypothetical protein
LLYVVVVLISSVRFTQIVFFPAYSYPTSLPTFGRMPSASSSHSLVSSP